MDKSTRARAQERWAAEATEVLGDRAPADQDAVARLHYGEAVLREPAP